MGRQIGDAQLKDIVTQGQIRTSADLIITHWWQHVNDWEFLQLKHLVSTISQPIRGNIKPN